MKVLHIIQRYWPYEGGSEGVFKETSERLAAEGHMVTVCTSDVWDIERLWSRQGRRLKKRAEIHNGVSVRRFPASCVPFQSKVSKGLGMLPFKRLRMFGTHPMIWMPRFFKAVNKAGDFDLVVAGVLPYDVFLQTGLRVARAQGIPFIAWPMLHLGLGKVESLENPFLMRERLEIVAQADHILVNTEAEIPALTDFGICSDKISVGGLGVTPEHVWGGNGARFRDKHGLSAPIVLQLSKQIIDKGSQHTVEAMKKLWEKGVDAVLVLAGQTTENFDSYWFKQPGSVLEKTLVLDYVSSEEKKNLLDAADILVMPSKADSFGIVYLEAWLYKKPVIGAFAGGIPALIRDGKDGMLVPYGDSHFLAETILSLLRSPELRETLGNAGYQKAVDQFNWTRQYEKTRKVYEKVLSEK